MADYAEEWQSAGTRRAGPPRLVLEAALELAILGLIGVTVAALGLLPLTWCGAIIAVLCYAMVTFLVVAGLSLHAPHRHFGIANSITLSRAAFGVLLLAVAAEEAFGSGQVLDTAFRWGLTIAAAMALLLDGVDGWVARRSKMTSGFGVRFDMEADGLFLLSLTLILFVGGIVGPWVLVSGVTYYLFRLAGHFWPVLAAPLFPSWRRKAIFGIQAALLIAAIAPSLPLWMAQLCCLTGVVLLLYSFAVDIAWLVSQWWRSRYAVENCLPASGHGYAHDTQSTSNVLNSVIGETSPLQGPAEMIGLSARIVPLVKQPSQPDQRGGRT